MNKWKKILGAGSAIGLITSGWMLHNNNYDVNSLGLVRLARAGATGVAIAIHYKTQLYSKSIPVGTPEYSQLVSRVHTEAANMLLKLCCANRGVYVKIGQHVGALEYLVPPEYVQVMKVLHSDAPTSSFSDILSVLEQDLQRDPYDVFSHIDENPLGAASLAQVHKAVLRKDGTTVAVKVQHPLVLRNSLVDMKTMEVLVKIMSFIFKDFNFQWLVDESKRNLPKELDFRIEAKNAEKAHQQLSYFPWLKIPRVHWGLTTRRVLTMEFEEGGKVTDLKFIDENHIKRSQVTELLGEMYSHMIFKHGFVHSDPHPGNILLRKHNGKLNIVLLDHGLYADLTDDFRINYSKFWMSILSRDLDRMKVDSTALGIGELFPLLVCMVTGRTWESVTTGVDKVEFSNEEKITFQREIPQYLDKIGEVLQKVNREMLLMLKTNDLLRGIEYHLDTHKKQSSYITMTRCCINNIYQQRLNECSGFVTRVRLTFEKQYNLWKLNAYSFYLNLVFWVSLLVDSKRT